MIETVRANRRLLDKFLEEGRIIYGVTTDFGENDRCLYPDIAYITDRVRDCTLVDLVEKEIGALEF